MVSTEMAHEVGGDLADVKSQDVPVIVRVGSPTGKALIPGRAKGVAATRVLVGLYSLLLVTVSIKGILPSLPCTGVVVLLAAAALERLFQLSQGLQLPFDVASSLEVAWYRVEASQETDVPDIVQCGDPRGKR